MSNSPECFSSEHLLAALRQMPVPGTYWLGFSGGADSTALLVALDEVREKLNAPIHALHFHHGLNSEADLWMQHCRQFCGNRDIPFTGKKLDIMRSGGTSIEEAARDSRYAAVTAIIEPGDIYLTAHHADDQAETLFLNLMRGSGVEGLAGIPQLRKIEQAWVARPLLDQSRDKLESFLNARSIGWLEDPSNVDESFDRNFLRQKLFPLLEQRWPGVTGRLTRTARHARQTSSALASYIDSHAGDLIRHDRVFSLDLLLQFDRELQALILRQWLRRQEIPNLPESRIREFLSQLNTGSSSGQAEAAWGSWLLKRYRKAVYLQEREPMEPCPEKTWSSGTRLELGNKLGALEFDGIKNIMPGQWQVSPRREGDRLQLHAKGPRRKIKHLLQESAIPPWMRSCIPVLYRDKEPVAVGDWLLAPGFKICLAERQAVYHWRPADPLLVKLQSDCHDSKVDR